jgi:hypothetical protein
MLASRRLRCHHQIGAGRFGHAIFLGLVDCPRATSDCIRRRYAMALSQPAFPQGMTGQPIWSLQ